MSGGLLTTPDEGTATGAESTGGASRRPWIVLGLAAVLAVPIVVAVVAVASPRWYPTLDYALTETRVRDVGGSHTPLVGLPGRLGRGVSLDDQGHHPGPLSFLALAPAYRALGSTSWALQAATGLLNAVALGVALWLAHRRGGPPVALGLAAALAVLVHAYGPELLVEPWNPYLPLMWWVVFLVAVWSVLCDDRAALPVAVFAGCFCMQTHISYVGLVAGLTAVAAVVMAHRAWRRPEDGRAAAGGRRRWPARWLALSAGLLVVLWVPPLLDQVGDGEGNLSLVADTFLDAEDTPVGLGDAVRPWLAHLDVGGLLTGEQGTNGSMLPGLALLAVWLVTVVVARRLADTTLQRLHLVVAGALAFGLLSISRVLGVLFDYLMLWAWGTTALLLVALGWTMALALARGRAQAAYGALAVVLVVVIGVQVGDAVRADPPGAGRSRVFGELVPLVADGLEDGSIPGTGRDGRYLIGWDDPLMPPSGASGLLLGLERRGFDVAFDEMFPAGFSRHRTMPSRDATARLTVVAGEPAIEEWRRDPDAVEVADAAARPSDEADLQRFQADLTRRLERAGRDDLVPLVDENLLGLMTHPDCPYDVRRLLVEATIGSSDFALPVAVFVVPL